MLSEQKEVKDVSKFKQDNLSILLFDEIESKGSIDKKNGTECLKAPTSVDPAVIMYTSGSTGEPKA